MKEFAEIERLVTAVHFKESQAAKELNRVLPEGLEIVFRAGNMKTNHNATIIRAYMCHGWPRIIVKNNLTGKRRKISLSDIRGI